MQSIWSPSVAPTVGALGERRGFCPRCGARRMVESAALLVDEVLPQQPMRQWVLSVPFPLRFLFASQPKIMGKALGIVYRTIAHRLARYLERQGLLVRDAEHSCLALESSDEDPMDQLRGHSMMCMDSRMPRAQERRPTASLWDLSKGAKSLPCKRCPTSVMPTAPRRLETWPAYSGHPALRPSGQPSAVQNRSRRFCLLARRCSGESR